MIIKKPMTDAQLKTVANRSLPSEAAQLQAMKDFIDYAAIKLAELEEKQNAILPSLQSAIDYTC